MSKSSCSGDSAASHWCYPGWRERCRHDVRLLHRWSVGKIFNFSSLLINHSNLTLFFLRYIISKNSFFFLLLNWIVAKSIFLLITNTILESKIVNSRNDSCFSLEKIWHFIFLNDTDAAWKLEQRSCRPPRTLWESTAWRIEEPEQTEPEKEILFLKLKKYLNFVFNKSASICNGLLLYADVWEDFILKICQSNFNVC